MSIQNTAGIERAIPSSPACRIDNAINRTEQIEQELHCLLQDLRGVKDPGGTDKQNCVRQTPSLLDILNSTDQRLDEHTQICLNRISELRQLLLG